ncbi:neuronal acetylcholine receptor subunit beta-3-like [Ylistrum balloti]|uniref:neuronal acetylcholine receptor subunit beta-3-like n=1 Tax=Ylistrum balloti TaxID=509963 RepID=UPI002905B576|nr:neuronal acetylcholine receptor subunit beta-3-like [Ylistrum balloti]
MGIMSINDLDELSGTITLTVIFHSIWKEERFTWNPELLGGLKSLTLPQESVWLPEMVLTTAADDTVHISTKGNFKVRVDFTGLMNWWRIGIIKSACVADVTYFPYDFQKCHVVLSPFGYQTEEISIVAIRDTISFDHFSNNGQWKVKSSSVKVNSLPMTKDKIEDSVVFANFTLEIERKSLYFVVSVIIPIALLALLNPCVFALPIESGERVSFAITVLLSFAVFESMVSDYMPQGSDPMSLLSLFLVITLLNSTLITITTILLHAMYHKDDTDAVPEWLVQMHLFIRQCTPSRKINPAYPRPEDKETISEMSDSDRKSQYGHTEKSESKMATSINDVDTGMRSASEDSAINWRQITETFDRIFLVVFLLFNFLFCLVFFLYIS